MKSVVKRSAAAMLITLASVGSMLVTSPTASGASLVCSDGGYEKRWLWEQAGGNNIGQACYWDSGNHLNIDDQEQDGHSLLLHLRNPSNGRSWTYWDSSGAEGPGSVTTITQFADNVVLEGRLCKGEWSSTNPQVLWNTCRAFSNVRL